MITVACVLVKGHVVYQTEYVTNLRAMVARHLQRPHRFVCLTDRPQWLSHVETIQIPTASPLKGWWAKIRLFDQSLGLSGRVLYLDLDTLVVGSLDPIVDFPAPFALVPDAGTFRAPAGLSVVKRFNSSVMVWDAGVNASLYDQWTPAVASRLWGDQDWIGEQMPYAAPMPLGWFPRLSELGGKPPTNGARVVLAKKPKNVIAADLYPWFNQKWRRV
jgi:hypothetical protein